MTLTEFLLERLAEDEAVAQAAAEDTMYGGDNGHWVFIEYDYEGCWPTSASDLASDAHGYDPDMTWTNHAARHDPARVVAECEAKRRIVDWCSEREMVWAGTMADDPENPRPEHYVAGGLAHPNDAVVLRFLALPYADHPDYREEWKP